MWKYANLIGAAVSPYLIVTVIKVSGPHRYRAVMWRAWGDIGRGRLFNKPAAILT